MKILYTGLDCQRYQPALGKTNEYNNFYLQLKNDPEHQVLYLPFERILEVGKKAYNQEILDTVKRERPDLFFAFLYTDELEIETLDEIKKYTKSLAWLSDDHWRLHNYSRLYASHFTNIATTWSKAPELYAQYGINNVISSQWGVNTNFYKPIHQNKIGPDVSFVGSWSAPRAQIIKKLKRAGIDVACYGIGWPNGRISIEKLLEIFSTSKINLGLNPAPGLFNADSLGRLIARRSVDRIIPDFHFIRNIRSWLNRNIPQIKARHFEIPACSGFLISGPADNLEAYYETGKEIAIYQNTADLIEKIHYYLARDDERKSIAQAGYQRTIKEHTYEKRLRDIFSQMAG